MPAIRRTVFNPEGEQYVPDAERINIQQQQFGAAHQAAMEQLKQNLQLAQMASADNAASRASTERVNGLYADKARDSMAMATLKDAGETKRFGMGEQGATDRQNIVSRPSIMEQERLNRGFDADAEQRKAAGARSALEARLYGKLGEGLDSAGSQGMDTDSIIGFLSGHPVDRVTRDVQRSALLRQEQEAKENRARTRAQSFADAGDIAQAEQIAAEAGVALAKPKYGNADASITDLLKSAGEFGAKDAAMVGWDPTESDMASLDTQANQAIALLERDYRMPHEQALQIVNQKIQQELAKRKGVNTGMIDQFLAKRGLK